MATPYDGKILVVNWKARTTPGETPAECAQLIRAKMPNVAGIMLKTSNGTRWQGELNDYGAQAITGPDSIAAWVEAFEAEGLEVHVWGVPRAQRRPGGEPDLQGEAEKFIQAAQVPGVKSLLLDVEHGRYYWLGAPAEARSLMALIRQGLPAETHIALVLDGRRNRPFDVYVDPWIPQANSLHPMIYPIMFGRHKSIDEHIDAAFDLLEPYGLPIVPMLQSVAEMGGRPTPKEIVQQGDAAFERGAAGISFFRLGIDEWGEDGKPYMGELESLAVAQIKPPVAASLANYSWHEVIQASAAVAGQNSQDWKQWFAQAGVWQAFNDFLQKAKYNGPDLVDWPLSKASRDQLIAKLGGETQGGETSAGDSTAGDEPGSTQGDEKPAGLGN